MSTRAIVHSLRAIDAFFEHTYARTLLYLAVAFGGILCFSVSCGTDHRGIETADIRGTATLEGEIVPSNITRVRGGPKVPKGPGWPPRVAILDTGIDASNPDLNVVGGVSCATDDDDDWIDTDGHGTSLAGVVGARHNGEGIVGVAPGAALYAVRVFANETLASEDDILCGLAWVYDNAKDIDVALTAFNRPDDLTADSADCESDRLREAVCRLHEAGVTVVVAAGNQKADASGFVPAKLNQVISVGAIVDFDGALGGLGSPTCGPGVDDQIADFSNTGTSVDIYGPGVCIHTTRLEALQGDIAPSGTSLAAAHVAGAAAVYIACHVNTTPNEVRDALLESSETVLSGNVSLPTVAVVQAC